MREKIQPNEIKMDHVDTCKCVADILTKPLLKSSFVRFTLTLGVISQSM